MKIVIVGCGRVGSVLADSLDRAGHEVIIVDTATSAFDRLPGSFGGAAIRGDGTDEDTLRRVGADGADLFAAMTEGDNRNIMAAQLATEALNASQVIAKINDPLRAAAYADLGIATICRTNLMASAVSDFLGLSLEFGPGISAPTGHHPGGEHHAAELGDLEGTTATAGPMPAGATPAASSTPAGSVTPATPSGSASSGSTTAPAAVASWAPAPAAPVTAREG